MKYFIRENSIVRKIWGKADTLLFIFAGAAAEFALNKAVDWLYFTGRLPANPLERLFSTVTYSQKIIFSTYDEANRVIDKITGIHHQVEVSRGAKILGWAYRDVLFMLIDYSIRAYELLERKLTEAEKAEVFNVFYIVGTRMKLEGLPNDYYTWQVMRKEHLQQNLQFSNFTADLFKQYKTHLGITRYWLLKQVHALIVPQEVKKMLHLGSGKQFIPLLYLYKHGSTVKLQRFLRDLLLPEKYKAQIQSLDRK